MRLRVSRVLLLAAFADAAALTAQDNEVRLGLFTTSARRNVLADGVVGKGGGSPKGAEFFLRSTGGGLYLRYLTAEFDARGGVGGAGPLRQADARVLLGPQVFNVEAGYSRRARSSQLKESGDSTGEDLIRLGGRSTVALGPSGFSIVLAAAAYARSDKKAQADDFFTSLRVVGWDAETGVLYQAPRRLPFFALLGYRYERLRGPEVSDLDPNSPGFVVRRREELSGIVLSAGIRHLFGAVRQ